MKNDMLKKMEENQVEGGEFGMKGFKVRYVQAFLMFSSFTVVYGMRVTMSVAIVAMTDKHNTSDDITIFDWNKQIQDLILSSFFWGYVLMQLPGGQIAHKYGAKYLMVVALLVNGFVAIIIPWAARVAGWKAVCFCRVLQGLSQGSFLPSLHTLQGKWAPISERGRFSTYIYGGSPFGTVIVMPISGLLAATTYGWPLIFYVFGAINIIFGVIWGWFGSESPAHHKTISEQERNFIQKSLGQVSNKKALKVPWRRILTCVPVWAMIMAHMGSGWVHVTLFTEIPSYLNKIMGIDIKSNGILSALPFLGNWIVGNLLCNVFDYITNKKLCTMTTARKVANSMAMIGVGVGLIIFTLIPPNQVVLAVTVLVIAVSIKSVILVGYHVNHIDLSPNFAGIMMSITNIGSNSCAVLAPITAGLILEDQYNPVQWRMVFYLSASLALIANTIYVIFGSAELQTWNEPEINNHDKEMVALKTSNDKTMENKL